MSHAKKNLLLSITLLFCISSVSSQVIRRGKPQVQESEAPASAEKEPNPFIFKKQNMISMSISDIAFTNITLKYEYFKKNGMLGLQLPMSFNAGGMPDTSDYHPGAIGRFLYARNRIFQTGLNLNYYLDGQSKISNFVGIGVAAGWFYYWKYNFGPPPPGTFYSPRPDKLIGNNASFAFHAGVLYNPREALTFSLKAGFGLRRYTTIYNEYAIPFGFVDLSVGFKFN